MKNNKRTIAGLMAVLMVLAVILSIPVMTMNRQVINDPNTYGNTYPYVKEIGLTATPLAKKHGLTFAFSFHAKDSYPEEGNTTCTTGYPFASKDESENIEKIDLATLMKTDEWEKIKAMCYHHLYVIKTDKLRENGADYIAEIKILPIDYYFWSRTGQEHNSIYGLLDGNHTITLELPENYVDPDNMELPEPTENPYWFMATPPSNYETTKPVIEQPPADNAVTLAPTIQVDNKPMSVKHSTLTVTINGVPTELDAIVLTEAGGGAHTYYKLRDVGEKVGFDVDWTPETGITVSTN